MYLVYNDQRQVIAFHKKERVVLSYCETIDEQHGEKLYIKKLKGKSEKKFWKRSPLFKELYLEKQGRIYVQKGHLGVLQLAQDKMKQEAITKCTSEVSSLQKVIDTRKLKKREYKALKNTIDILENSEKESVSYLPTLAHLQELEQELIESRTNAFQATVNN